MAKSMRIRTDDHVLIKAGKDRGKQGKVVRVDPKRRKVYVEGLSMIKRHQRPTSMKDTQKGGQTGGIIEKEGPVDISNVVLIDPSDNKPTKIGIRAGDDGKRQRFSKRTGKAID
jgi:large subunit ribosomal protein L24